MRRVRGSAASGADVAKGFGKAEAARKDEKKRDRKWELEAVDMPEWAQWLSDQREAAGVKDNGVYVQVRQLRAAICGEMWTLAVPALLC